MIHPCVRDAFYDFSAQFEGVVPCMYLDVRGLVTTGVGNLIDSTAAAEALPWTVHTGGQPATPEQIATEWQFVKWHPDLARLGAGAAGRVTLLRLSGDAIRALVASKLDEMVTHLAARFDLASWPADAQLAVCSMAWAMGPGFVFPRFAFAVARLNFDAAAIECTIREDGNPGVKPRNAANRVHLGRAAFVLRDGLPLDAFYDQSAADSLGAEDHNP